VTTPSPTIRFEESTSGVDWKELKKRLADDRFDNGRTPDQLRRSFESSFASVFAFHGEMLIGTARVLSDGICNAYLVDVWTHAPFRRMGIASAMVHILEKRVQGQHVALFTEDAVPLYQSLGYAEERVGMSKVVGKWLDSGA